MKNLNSITLALFLWSCLLSNQAFSTALTANSSKEGEQGKPQSKKKSKKKKTSDTKAISLGLKAGNFMGGIIGGGGEAMDRIFDRTEFGGFVMAGTEDLRDEIDATGVNLNTFELSGLLGVLQVRQYWTETFYASLGFGIRKIDFEIDISDTSGNHLNTTAEATSYAFNIAIGNIWSWDNGFYLGADWIGFTLPVSSSYTSSTNTQGAISDFIEEVDIEASKVAKKLGKVTSGQALLLNIGWRF